MIARTEWLGYTAASLTTLPFLPQVWLSWKTRQTAGVSLVMYSILTLGVALWLGYGLMLGSRPVVIANSITLALTLFIIALRIRFGR